MATEIARLAVVLEYPDGQVVMLESKGRVVDLSLEIIPLYQPEHFDPHIALTLPRGFSDFTLHLSARMLSDDAKTYTTTKMSDWPIGGEDA